MELNGMNSLGDSLGANHSNTKMENPLSEITEIA